MNNGWVYLTLASLAGVLYWTGLFVLLTGAQITILNALTTPRLTGGRAPSNPLHWPSVSVLVPARDEAGVISACVQCLLTQEYPGDLELLVLDDQSEDGTGDLARQAIGVDGRGKVIDGLSLPPGWVGKNWACAQLASHAHGEILVFTDADVQWESGALAAVVRLMLHHAADCLSAMPTQRTQSWSEHLVVPMIGFLTLGFLPEIGVRTIRLPLFGTANGQCLGFRRSAYERVGGHDAVRSSIIEDIMLAKQVKRCGLKLVIAQAGGLVSTRMYTNWQTVRHGFAKNILALHGGRPAILALSMTAQASLFIAPFLWLAAGWLPAVASSQLAAANQPAHSIQAGWPVLPATMVALALAIRLLTAAVSGARLRETVLLPVSVSLLLLIAAQAVWWHYRQGGPQWKGRRIQMDKKKR